MIENLKAYPSFDSLGGNAIKIRASTEKSSYSVSVPVKGDLKRLLRIFSSIRPNFIGLDEKDWQSIDTFIQELIPRENNLSLAMSLAIARSGFDNDLWKLGMEKDFPFPLVNVISNREAQEFFIIPHRAGDPKEAARICLEAYNAILEELKKTKKLSGRSPDGSWFCNLDLLKALEFLSTVAEDWELKIGADFSASRFWNGKTYNPGSEKLGPEKYLDFIDEISYTYRIYYLEDPFHRDDFTLFSALRERLKKKLVIGKELYRSDRKRLEKGLEMKSGNGVVISPIQIGTLSEILSLSGLARKGGSFPIISQNPEGEETGDSYLADISILCNAPLLKTGLSGSESLSKINRLIELWHEIPDAKMAGLL